MAPRLLNCARVGRIIDKLSLHSHHPDGDVTGKGIQYALLKA